MRIGIVTTWFSSGAGMVSKNYEQTFQKKHDVFIYCRGDSAKDDSNWNGKNVTWAEPHPCSTGIYKSHFKKWIKLNDIEIILFNEQRHWKSVLYAKKLGIIIGAYIDYYTSDTVPFFNLYDFLICNTKRHYSVFKDHPQSCYCAWGTDIDLYKPEKRPDRPITFIIIAGNDGHSSKGTPWLDRRGTGMVLKVFPKVMGDCRLIILSMSSLDQCPDYWVSAVKNDMRIDFRVGNFFPVPYTLGDVYLYPSRLDGIGLTLPEALSCGLAGITTNSQPMNEFVYEGKNGSLIDVEAYLGRPDGYYWAESICEEKKLKSIIQRYVDSPLNVYKYGLNARKIAESELSWEQNSAFLVDWITKQKIIYNNSNNAINGVKLKIVKWYDRKYNPTPLEKVLVDIKALVISLIRFFRGKIY